jgi:UPF0271 protein
MTTIDINADLGEGFGPWRMGDDAAMLDVVTSASIACGGHAGDPDTMVETLRRAADRGVVAGAHPGYADREGFGRRVIPMAPAAIARMVAAQIGALAGAAALAGTPLRFVKPHGALGGLAADRRDVADAIAGAVVALNAAAPGRGLGLLCISGTELEVAGREAGLTVYSEIYADRGYLPTGRLVPRNRPDALIHDPAEAADRLLRFLDSGLMPAVEGPPMRLAAQSVCVHGDGPTAVAMVRGLRDRLTAAGVTVAPFAVG